MRILAALFGALLIVPPAVAAESAAVVVAERFGLELLTELPPRPSLTEYLGFALARNGGLAAADAQALASRAAAEAAGALPEPRFSWSEAIVPVETRLGPQERVLSLTQQLPWFGTLGLERAVVAARADGAGRRAEAAALTVLREVRTAYHELVHLDEALVATRSHLDLLTQAEAVARSRYETGDGPYADVIRAQVEMAQLEERLWGLRDLRRPLSARMNAVLGRASDAPLNVGPADAVPVATDLEDLRARLLAANPELAALDSEAASRRRAEELAGKRKYPGLNVGMNWVQIGPARNPDFADGGRNAALATVGISLPLWRGSYEAAERAAGGRYREVAHRRADLARRLEARLERTVYELRDAVRRRDLYRDALLPKARQSLAASRAAYEAGDATFLDLIDAERVLLEFELARARAAADLAIGRADLEALVAGQVVPREGRNEN